MVASPLRTVAALAVLVVAGLGACSDASSVGTAEGEPAAPPSLHPDVDVLDRTRVSIATDDGEVALAVRVAATAEERQRGLMHVPDLPDGVGMLFRFDDDRDGGFWMKDTLVPLDIAFVDADGRIVAILAMDPCEADPCPVYAPAQHYRSALEVRQGWFAEVGVAVGNEVTWAPPVPADG